MTPEEKIVWFKQHHGAYANKVSMEIKRLVESVEPFDQKAPKLLSEIDKIMACFRDVSPCRKGCSFCCYQSVIVFRWEAQRIADYTKRTILNANIPLHKWNQKMHSKYLNRFKNVPCPFLKDGVCSVYEVRPMSCRVHISLADDSFPCDIAGNPGASVPYVNVNAERLLWSHLCLQDQQSMADIREFFNGT